MVANNLREQASVLALERVLSLLPGDDARASGLKPHADIDDGAPELRGRIVRHRIRHGEGLFAAGDPFRCLYAIRAGFFKTGIVDRLGREQVTGFFMPGELLGMDGMGGGRYHAGAMALEDSEVYGIPYALVEDLGRENPSLQRRVHQVLAAEIVRSQGVMMLLGSLSAEARLAAFLLNLSRRLLRRGYSSSTFVMRMTREEIGSYLGLKLETVSRIFSSLQKSGILEVQQKRIVILDAQGLERRLVQ